jgi:uncharacterized protein YciI
VSEWLYFIHPPREDFAATMTVEEETAWGLHFERFREALADGAIILVGPTLGSKNTGICIFEAPDEATAQRFMDEDPVFLGDLGDLVLDRLAALVAPRPGLMSGFDDGTGYAAIP